MLDKFGIEIKKGDLIVSVDTFKDYPCVLGVALGEFTKCYTRWISLHIWSGRRSHIFKTKELTRNIVIINYEQLESLTKKIIETRVEYAKSIRNGITDEEEEARTKELIEKLIEKSNKLKNE